MDEASSKERAADMILQAAYELPPLDVFEQADRLSGDDRTQIEVSNAGRYGALHGGDLALLKEEPPVKGGRWARKAVVPGRARNLKRPGELKRVFAR